MVYKIYMEIVGTIFAKDNKTLICKPVKRSTYQMIGGRIEKSDASTLDAAIRQCYREMGIKNLDPNLFDLVMEFDEGMPNNPNLKMHFYVYQYKGELPCEPKTNEDVEGFLWYDSRYNTDILSPTLKTQIIPYCIKNGLIK